MAKAKEAEENAFRVHEIIATQGHCLQSSWDTPTVHSQYDPHFIQGLLEALRLLEEKLPLWEDLYGERAGEWRIGHTPREVRITLGPHQKAKREWIHELELPTPSTGPSSPFLDLCPISQPKPDNGDMIGETEDPNPAHESIDKFAMQDGNRRIVALPGDIASNEHLTDAPCDQSNEFPEQTVSASQTKHISRSPPTSSEYDTCASSVGCPAASSTPSPPSSPTGCSTPPPPAGALPGTQKRQHNLVD